MAGRLRRMAEQLKREAEVYRLVLKDRRTPWLARVLLGSAVAYALWPVDLIPDFIPVVGHLDDLVIVPLLAWAGIKLIPRDVIRECREQVAAAAGRSDGNSMAPPRV